MRSPTASGLPSSWRTSTSRGRAATTFPRASRLRRCSTTGRSRSRSSSTSSGRCCSPPCSGSRCSAGGCSGSCSRGPPRPLPGRCTALRRKAPTPTSRPPRAPGSSPSAPGPGAPARWRGRACICAAGVTFSSSTAFPGWAALLPTVGAALVIAAAPGGASRLLSLAPFRYVGDRSYAFYLWHWPVLVIAAEYAGHELSGAVRLGLLAGAFGLSILSYAVYENPIRQMRWRPQTGALLWPASAAVVLVVAVPILAARTARATWIAEAPAAVRPTQLGQATAVRGSWAPLPAVAAAVAAAKRGAALPSPLTPAPTDLRNDFYAFPAGCAAGRNRTSSTVCHLGASGAAKTIAVIGDSHAQMWMPTILRMARRDGWEVVPFVKVGCIPTKWLHTKDWGCTLWYRWAVGRAAKLHPQVTLIAASWADDPHPTAAVRAVSALIGRVKPFSAPTIVVGDSPHQHRNPVDCLLASGSTMRSCTARASLTELHTDASVAATAQQHGVGFIKVTGWFCARASNVAVLCPLVVNRTVSWIDLGHISETYGLELTTPFRSAFRRELFR